MKTTKVLTGYTGLTDGGALTTSESIITGCTDNAAFTFTKSELTNLVLYHDDYAARLSAVATGTKQDKVLKKESKQKLIGGLKVITTEINHQQAGNTSVLESSGAPLWANAYQKKGGDNPVTQNLKADFGTEATELKVKVKKTPGLHDYGTVFAYTLALNAVDNINVWTQVFETGHSTTLTGLQAGTKYLVSAAYKGAKGSKLIWCKPLVAFTKPG